MTAQIMPTSERSENANHPKKGSSIKVEPIRDKKAIKRIRKLLADAPRNLCLFDLGVNTAFRANELLSLTVGQVDYLNAGDVLELKQSKTRKYRPVKVNRSVVAALDYWLKHHPDTRRDAPLFLSRKSNAALRVPVLTNMIKDWCRNVGLRENYGSHTLRKTWGYHQRVYNGTPIELIMAALGHESAKETMLYLGIEDHEVSDLYDFEI